MSDIYSIYKFTNKTNNKSYIGLSKNPYDRKRYHKYGALTKLIKTKFYNAIRKYGFECFKFEIICQTKNIDYSKQLEKYFIINYNSIDNGYNILSGGDGITGFKHSQETISKMKKKIPWNKGLKTGKQSIEHKQKAAATRKGKLRGPYKGNTKYNKKSLAYQKKNNLI